MQTRKNKNSESKKTKLPDEIGIGRALNWEVDDTANKALQEAGMPESVPSPELVKLESVVQRKSPVKREKSSTVNHRHRQQNCQDQERPQRPHFESVIGSFFKDIDEGDGRGSSFSDASRVRERERERRTEGEMVVKWRKFQTWIKLLIYGDDWRLISCLLSSELDIRKTPFFFNFCNSLWKLIIILKKIFCDKFRLHL